MLEWTRKECVCFSDRNGMPIPTGIPMYAAGPSRVVSSVAYEFSASYYTVLVLKKQQKTKKQKNKKKQTKNNKKTIKNKNNKKQKTKKNIPSRRPVLTLALQC